MRTNLPAPPGVKNCCAVVRGDYLKTGGGGWDQFHPVSATCVSGLECANFFGRLICDGEALVYAIAASRIYHASPVIMANL